EVLNICHRLVPARHWSAGTSRSPSRFRGLIQPPGVRGLTWPLGPAGRTASGLAAEVLHDGQGQDLRQRLEVALALFGAGRGRIAEVGVLSARLLEGLGALLEAGHESLDGREADPLPLAHAVRSG